LNPRPTDRKSNALPVAPPLLLLISSTSVARLTRWLYTRLSLVNSWLDHCNTVLAGAARTVTDKLQRVLNAAARVVTGTRKSEQGAGCQILHDELH